MNAKDKVRNALKNLPTRQAQKREAAANTGRALTEAIRVLKAVYGEGKWVNLGDTMYLVADGTLREEPFDVVVLGTETEDTEP